MTLRIARVVIAGAFALLASATETAGAQGDPARPPTPGRIRGRVVDDSTGTPIAGARVVLPKSNRAVLTDSAGRYEIAGLAPETTLVIVRAPGFVSDSTTVAVRNRLLVNLELRLAYERVNVARRIVEPQPLPTVTTEATAPEARGRMDEFNHRKQMGIGRFIDREMLAKWENRKTGDLFGTVGGVQVKTGGMKNWISNGRANDASCTFCRNTEGMFAIVNEADFSAGARPACYMDVWLDGVRMYQFGFKPPQPLFDVNSLSPYSLEGVEVYVGTAQIPAKYNSQFSSGCGVVLFWTRISPDKKP
jgi:hypothetical protein